MKTYAVLGKLIRAFVYLFLLLPLLIVIITSFSDTRFIVFPPQGFTFHWFSEAAKNTDFISSVKTSFIIAGISTCISTFLGTVVSLYFWKTQGKFKGIIEIVFLSPVVVPTVVSAVAFMQYYAASGLFNSNFIPLILSHSIIQIAYVIRTISATLYSMDAGFEEASLVLGATPLRTLFKVTLPCAKRGIIAGAIFAFIVSFDEAVVVMFMSDPSTVTYPLRLFSYISEQFSPMISAFSTLFIIFSFLIIVIVEKTVGLNKMY